MQTKSKTHKNKHIYTQHTVETTRLQQTYDRESHRVRGGRKVVIQAQISCVMQQIKTIKNGDEQTVFFIH